MTNLPQVRSYPTNDKLSLGLAEYVLNAQAAAFSRHPKFRIAVSGGSLPSILASPALIDNPSVQWSKWEIFFADERAVPLDHPDSNYGLLKSVLLDKIPQKSSMPKVFPIDELLLDDTQELADAYEQTLIQSFAAKDSVKLPIFDLILLGCGPDGHTCSLFPGHELLREDIAWVAPIEDSPKPPPRRITLTLPVVTHAVRVVFVAAGAGKKEILKTIFEKPEEGLPCSLVNMEAGDKVVWFTDDAAIQGVTGVRKGSL
ncbi:6-phosphogluconolactonase [Terfezia boudieri ATCC MYA-4762]|uniref:6-phosphogluconolactonase n=1 Tax=Terfezia boudieri ATCC MYA-4762 TaxID=1051890 RepID=A0A3N4LSC1_9PEZI|nr:6-phosphogluconolactonase [Terfezia boudieri ATCC MYA-4762]